MLLVLVPNKTLEALEVMVVQILKKAYETDPNHSSSREGADNR